MAALGSPDSSNGSLSRLNARVVRALLRAMMRLMAGLLVALSTVPLAAQPTPGRLQPTPAALEIFQRDWVLMNWALKYFDADRDILLEPGEAQAAAEALRRIADADHDGRVTPEEYRAARAFILARY